MNVDVLQHVPFEGPGSIADWADARGARLAVTRLFAQEQFPDPTAVDLLVVMGGPMGANDHAVHAWLADEQDFIRQVIAAGKPVLGVCLGAQLIAAAMGARVFPNADKEIGWFPVSAVRPGGGDAFGLPEEVTVLHWHGDTFELPPGAALLATSEACANQAFLLGERVMGLQFHLETTRASLWDLVENCAAELEPGRRWVQSAERLLRIDQQQLDANQQLMGRILDFLTRP